VEIKVLKVTDDSRVKKRHTILVASLTLNLILTVSAVYLVNQNSTLADRLSELDSRVGGLNKELYSLQQRYELAQYQLQYYKSWGEKYWNSTGYEPSTSGLVGRSSINIVAVREIQTTPFEISYEGVVITVEVEIRRGEGRLLINTQPKIGIDLQASGQTAVAVVQALTGVSFEKTDTILTVRAESEVEIVDGPSAGAAITVCMIAALQNRTTNPSVFITGTVNSDGTIGKVGGITYKALAAAKKGASLFLVPPGQINLTIMIPKEESPIPGVTIVRYEEAHINLQQFLSEQGYDVKVNETRSIIDAYSEFVD